jgi:glycosyltransferase involved in cell wall biosynthesis
VLSTHGGAIERRIREVAAMQVVRGHEVTVFSVGDVDRVVQHDGYTVCELRCGIPYPGKHVQFQIRSVRKIMRISPRPGVIHFHSQPEGGVIALPSGMKTVLSYDFFKFRRATSGLMHALYRSMLRRFDLLLPVSQYCLHESREFWGLPDTSLLVVPNGVSPQQFYPDPYAGAEERARLGITGPVLLYVGRICEQKGADVLLAAYARIREKRPDISLVLAGPLEQFENTLDPHGWRARIEAAGAVYLGAVPESRLRAVYNMATLFVMPTVREEMFCMAAVEAEACGISVLASDHGGLREVVPSSVGRRFTTGDPEDLARSALSILGDSGTREMLAASALDNSTQYHWSRVCDLLDVAYSGSTGHV